MSNTEEKNEELRLIRLPEVLTRTGLSRPSIYRSMSAGVFPKSTRFGRATFWASHEVDGWIRNRLAERMEGAARRMKTQTKKPQNSRSGASDNALPVRPFKHTRRESAMQVDGLPELRTLDFELMILRALLTKPTRSLLFTKHYSLAKNRFTAFERVARAAMRDGYTQADAARLLLAVHTECEGSGFHFNATAAAWVVASQCEAPKSWVIAPATNKRPRIVGVTA